MTATDIAAVIAEITGEKRRNGGSPEMFSDEPIPEGQRDDTLTRIAGSLRNRGLGETAILGVLQETNNRRCVPPLADDQVRKIARSVSTHRPGTARDRTDPDAPDPNVPPPVVQVVDSSRNSVRVTAHTGETHVELAFTYMHADRSGWRAELGVTLPKPHGLIYRNPISPDWSRERAELRRELKSLSPLPLPWSQIVGTAISQARDTFFNQDSGIRVSDIPPPEGDPDLIRLLMPAHGATIMFGDGGSAKSLIAQALATSGVTGVPMAGFPVPNLPVLYIDYEGDQDTFRRRSDRIMAGFGSTAKLDQIIYWRAGGIPLRDQARRIRQKCDAEQVGWIIVDSAAPACGGAPDEAGPTLPFFAALDEIDLPALVIAHITKARNEESPFGSVFWKVEARQAWFVSNDDSVPDHLTVGLLGRKTNGPKLRDLAIKITFGGENGPISFAADRVDSSPSLHTHTSNSDRVFQALRRPMTVRQLSEELGMSQSTIKQILTTGPFEKAAKAPSTGGRNGNIWARRATADRTQPSCPWSSVSWYQRSLRA